MTTKFFIVLVLIAILVSLFSALRLLFRSDRSTAGMVKALTVRISLSLGLFAVLVAGAYFGFIPAHGLVR